VGGRVLKRGSLRWFIFSGPDPVVSNILERHLAADAGLGDGGLMMMPRFWWPFERAANGRAPRQRAL